MDDVLSSNYFLTRLFIRRHPARTIWNSEMKKMFLFCCFVKDSKKEPNVVNVTIFPLQIRLLTSSSVLCTGKNVYKFAESRSREEDGNFHFPVNWKERIKFLKCPFGTNFAFHSAILNLVRIHSVHFDSLVGVGRIAPLYMCGKERMMVGREV